MLAVRSAPMRVLIADDEMHSRRRLQDLLSREPDVSVVASVPDGVEAVDAIRRLRPDLVFLDVQMPEKTGLDVVRDVGVCSMPATVFVTAFDEYAVAAFDVAAVDYLVKPYSDERFEAALVRARDAIRTRETAFLRDQLLTLLGVDIGSSEALTTGDQAEGTSYLERIAVEIGGKVQPVPVEQIDYILAAGPYTELHVGESRHVIRKSMHVLEDQLDPSAFMRVHRSTIVRLDGVVSLQRRSSGEGELLLSGNVRLPVSRTRRDRLEHWLGVSRQR